MFERCPPKLRGGISYILAAILVVLFDMHLICDAHEFYVTNIGEHHKFDTCQPCVMLTCLPFMQIIWFFVTLTSQSLHLF